MKVISYWWKKLGPGFVTGASDDDPSGIATYSQAGAVFGLSMLWTALLTYPLMFSIQEMCARIGIITGNGLGYVINTHYPRSLVWIMLAVLFPAITFNIAANLAGMGAVTHLLFPFLPEWFYAAFFTFLLIWGLIFFSYTRLAFILKCLCVSLLVYLIIPFLIKQDWWAVLKASFLPHVEKSINYWFLLVAVFGTTLSPYLFFWQSSMSVEEKIHNHEHTSNPYQIKEMKVDVNFGMFWSNLVSFPTHFLTKFGLKAQQHHFDEVAVLTTSTLLEIAKTIMSEVNVNYAELQDPFQAIINGLAAIARSTFKKNKDTSIKVLMQPLVDLKALFQTEKAASYRDTPVIIQQINNVIDEFSLLEQVMQTLPSLPGMEQNENMPPQPPTV